MPLSLHSSITRLRLWRLPYVSDCCRYSICVSSERSEPGRSFQSQGSGGRASYLPHSAAAGRQGKLLQGHAVGPPCFLCPGASSRVLIPRKGREALLHDILNRNPQVCLNSQLSKKTCFLKSCTFIAENITGEVIRILPSGN